MRKRILIVDEDLLLSETIGNYLTLLQYRVIFASSTDEAIQKVISQKPHLIICESATLSVDGFRLLNYVKNNIACGHVAFVFLSSNNQQRDIINGMAAGADAYLTKPFEFEILHKTIRGLFAPKRKNLLHTV